MLQDRFHGGRVLAAQLAGYGRHSDRQVLALPRGGVAVGFEGAQALRAPLDVPVVRELGMPGQDECAAGAIAGDGIQVMNDAFGLAVSPQALRYIVAREQAELARRERLYRAGRPAPALQGKTVIVVDDGVATGSTMWAAVLAARRCKPARIVAAAPVGDRQACEMLHVQADEVVCAFTPMPFRAVGLWYENFPHATDAEVRDLLERAAGRAHAQPDEEFSAREAEPGRAAAARRTPG